MLAIMKPSFISQMQSPSLKQVKVDTAPACRAGRWIAAALVTALLAACGGGGSSASAAAGAAANTAAGVSTSTPVATPVAAPGTGASVPAADTGVTPSTASADKPTLISVGIVRLQNTGAAQTNVPFTFGHPFGPGSLKAGEGVTAVLQDGTSVPLQMEVKATHADGSARHVVISGILPMLAAGQTAKMQLLKSSPSASGTATPADLLATGLSAKTVVTVGGVPYTASLESALAHGKPMTWLSGNIASEWIVNAPLTDANGVAHPLLTARFGVRWYPGLTKQARVEFVVENDKTFLSNRQYTYDVDLQLGGKSVYHKAGLTHYHRARWHQYAWWDADHAPAVNVQMNASYLILSRAIPNYDLTVLPTESNIVDLANMVNASNTGPMTIGPVNAYMPTTGGRIDIGSLPSWSVTWLLTMDKRARDVMMAAADGSGAWSIHLRDENTDYPVRTDNAKNARISTHGNLNWTGPLPVPRCVNDDWNLCATPYTPDAAHQPSLTYLPYVITGDYYYLEELQFWAASNPLETDPGNSGLGQGLLRWMQVRGQAWSLRTLGQVAYITPDNHPLKAYFNTQLDNNLNWYNQTYVVGNPNNLGVYDGSGAGAFAVDTSAPWQDDFLTWSFNYLNELGYSKALPILKWKAKYSVGRMTDPGYCWVMGAAYNLKLFDANGKVFSSFGDLYKANFTGPTLSFDNVNAISTLQNNVQFANLGCDSQAQADWLAQASGYPWALGSMIGYAGSAMGYPANMQPALAAAVSSGIPNAAQAWSTFQARASKPDYRPVPQWAILPR